MRLSFATLLLCSFLLSSSFLERSMAVSECCTKTCAGTCSEAYVMDGCKQYYHACGHGTCGGLCNCVAGTCGYRSECPCGSVRETSRCC